MPKVSVLICVYNDQDNISRAIDSILSQSFQDFEIVIVNDGSTDQTGRILQDYALSDQRIRVIDQVNSGTTIAANNGLKYCEGDYIARLDSDDFSYPHRLEKEVEVLDSDKEIGMVGGGCHIVDNLGNIVGTRNVITSNPQKTLLHRCIFQQSDVMFRKQVVIDLGGYRNKFRNAQDYDLWLRISEKYKIVKLKDFLGAWTLNAGGYTLSRKKEQLSEVKTIKAMAQLRRSGQNDGYDQYQPATSPHHRKDITADSYQVIIASLLLKDLNKNAARDILHSCRKGLKEKILLLLTYSPDIVLRNLFQVREYYLNNFQ